MFSKTMMNKGLQKNKRLQKKLPGQNNPKKSKCFLIQLDWNSCCFETELSIKLTSDLSSVLTF